MTYELCKELKEAGFESRHSARDGKYPDKDGYVPPDLSELIEACGERFGSLTRLFKPDDNFFRAISYDQREITKGSTPEEAVARLWLALNKKQP